MFENIYQKLSKALINTKTLFFSGAFILVFLSAAYTEEPDVYIYPDLVVGIAEWRHENGPIQDVQGETFLNLTEKLEGMTLNKVSVVKIPVALQNANDVDAIATEFDVDMIVWGWYDEVAVRGFVDLVDATQENGMSNSIDAFIDHGGSGEVIRVLKVLSEFDYFADGVHFCVPRWTP